MPISKTTSTTEKLMKEIGKREPDEQLTALGYLFAMAANAVIDVDGAPWSARKAELLRAAEFCTARAAQCWTDEEIAAPIADIPDDPDEDIL